MNAPAPFDRTLLQVRSRLSLPLSVAVALGAAAAVLLSGCANAPGAGGTGEPAGDANARSFTWRGSGDQVFFLNPDGEALDKTLHTVRLGNDSAEVYVIATAGGEEADPQVEIVDLTGRAASRVGTSAPRPQPRPPSEPAPEPAWVEEIGDVRPRLERAAARLPGAVQPQRAVVRGSRETLRDIRDSAGNFNSIPATARAVVTDGTITAVVWVADREWACGAGCVTQPMADALANAFLRPGPDNDIYDWLTAIFGDPWGQHRYRNIIPPQAAGEIHVLLFDIDGDGLPRPGDVRVVGFFQRLHAFLRAGNPPLFRGSNERLMLFADSPFLTQDPDTIIGTLAHEFQHLIHFYQKKIVRDIDSETWFNEMASLVAQDLIADKLEIDGPRGVASDDAAAGDPENRFGRLPEYNRYNDIQVTAWDGTLANYSITYALGAYLARNYGGAELFGRIVQSGRSGVEAVEGALGELDHDVTFPQLLANWAAANLLSDNTAAPVPYRYNPGTWSTSRVGATTFRLGSINLYNYTHRSYPDRPGPYLHDLIAFNARTQPPHSNMYTTLGRVAGTLRLRVTAPAGNRITVVVKE